MATEKIINTRIQLKYSTLTEWSDVSTAGRGGLLVLKSGEIPVAAKIFALLVGPIPKI